jgi:hypothetical protein
MLFSLTVLFSCNKDSKIVPEDNNITSEYTADEMALWNQLNNFNLKIKNGLKSEEFISPDSAMWYLEALFNVQQAVDTTFDDVASYERTYTLDVNANGTVNMSNVTALYNQLVTDLNTELAMIDSDYKFLIIADLQQESLKSDEFNIKVTGGLGINPLVYYEPITNEDNWFYGNMLGRCDGTFAGQSDAGQELKRRFNDPKLAYPFPYNTWINPTHREVTPINYPTRIFNAVSPTSPCIEYDYLQNYLKQGHYIIYNSPTSNPTGERPSGLYFKLMDLWSNNPNPLDNEYWHKYLIWYGTPVNIPPID